NMPRGMPRAMEMRVEIRTNVSVSTVASQRPRFQMNKSPMRAPRARRLVARNHAIPAIARMRTIGGTHKRAVLSASIPARNTSDTSFVNQEKVAVSQSRTASIPSDSGILGITSFIVASLRQSGEDRAAQHNADEFTVRADYGD